MFLNESYELVALGAFAGAQVILVCAAVVLANAFGERALLLHGAATMMTVLTVQLHMDGYSYVAEAAMLATLALAGFELRDLVNHAGALRQLRRWLMGLCVLVLPVLALASALAQLHLLLVGVALWTAVVAVLMLPAWPQSQPWAGWLVAGLAALTGAAGWMGWHVIGRSPEPVLPLAAMLVLWAVTTFIASVWRSRIFSETRARLNARNTLDPLTGLATPLVMHERVRAAQSLMKRYGHPSVLLLVHLENLPAIEAEFGPEVAESAVIEAANRVRLSISDGDVAARVSHSRIAVLVEGASLAEGSANVASRILVAGLKEALPAAPTEFLRFRVVLALVPVADITAKALLQRLSARMDEQLSDSSERRIHALPAEEFAS
ncbi:MAG TPA: diguanylate cyclase [Ramlibacter sp.]|nr:diguanylate cyclase [Ramlibacter sp.]